MEKIRNLRIHFGSPAAAASGTKLDEERTDDVERDRYALLPVDGDQSRFAGRIQPAAEFDPGKFNLAGFEAGLEEFGRNIETRVRQVKLGDVLQNSLRPLAGDERDGNAQASVLKGGFRRWAGGDRNNYRPAGNHWSPGGRGRSGNGNGRGRRCLSENLGRNF